MSLPIFVSRALKSVSVLWIDSADVTVPPEFSKLVPSTSVSAVAYGLSSWMVATVFAFSFVVMKSLMTAAWILSLYAVRR